MTDKITCPNCGHQFDVEEALSGKFEAHYKAEFEKKMEEQGKRMQHEKEKLEDEKKISLSKILAKINKKMIFRHPHVFENPREVSVEEANQIWKEQKRKEREEEIVH